MLRCVVDPVDEMRSRTKSRKPEERRSVSTAMALTEKGKEFDVASLVLAAPQTGRR